MVNDLHKNEQSPGRGEASGVGFACYWGGDLLELCRIGCNCGVRCGIVEGTEELDELVEMHRGIFDGIRNE